MSVEFDLKEQLGMGFFHGWKCYYGLWTGNLARTAGFKLKMNLLFLTAPIHCKGFISEQIM